MQNQVSSDYLFHLAEGIEDIPIDLLYVILGMLDEYMGGYSVNSDGVTIETYTTYDEQHNQQGILFAKVCQKYLTTVNCQHDLKLTKTDNGLTIASNTIHQKIQEKYNDVQLENPLLGIKVCQFSSDDEIFGQLHANLALADFNFISKKISYLIGVFLVNNHNEKQTYFYNASHKAELTIELLKQFEGFGSSVKVEYFFNTPYATKITLDENNIFWKDLERFVQFINKTQIKIDEQ